MKMNGLDAVLSQIDYAAIGKRIRRARNLLHLTQKDLGDAVSLSTSFIGHVERGTRKASLETVIHIARVLDASLDVLLTGESGIGNVQITDMLKLQVLQGVLRVLRDSTDEWMPATLSDYVEEPKNE